MKTQQHSQNSINTFLLKEKKESDKIGLNLSYQGFPSSSAGKEPARDAGDPGLIPGSGRRDRLPTPVFLGFPGGLAGEDVYMWMPLSCRGRVYHPSLSISASPMGPRENGHQWSQQGPSHSQSFPSKENNGSGKAGFLPKEVVSEDWVLQEIHRFF